MKSYVQPGHILTLVAPYNVASGAGALIGSIFGIAATTVLAAASGEFQTEGVFELAKLNTQVWVQGDPIYWDNTNKRCDNTSVVGPRIGVATAAAANPTTTGFVRLDGTQVDRSPQVEEEGSPAPSSVATAGAGTVTVAHLLSGIYVRDCAGAGRTDTLPTAAEIVAAIPGAKVGDIISVLIVNGSDAAEAITIAAGTGGGFDANQTAASRVVEQNSSKTMKIRLTNVTPTTEAYVVYL